MRRDGYWMTRLDESVLEYLSTVYTATAGEVARQLRRPVTIRRVRGRLRVLSQAEYCAPVTDHYQRYELTSLGAAYLSGNVRADLLVPVPSARRSGHVLG